VLLPTPARSAGEVTRDQLRDALVVRIDVRMVSTPEILADVSVKS